MILKATPGVNSKIALAAWLDYTDKQSVAWQVDLRAIWPLTKLAISSS